MKFITKFKEEFDSNFKKSKIFILITSVISSLSISVLAYYSELFQNIVDYVIGFLSLTVALAFAFLLIIVFYALIIAIARSNKMIGYYIAGLLVIFTASTAYVVVINLFTGVMSLFDYEIIDSDLDRFITFISIVVASIVPIVLTLYTLQKSKEENLDNMRIQVMPFVNVYVDPDYDNFKHEYINLKLEYDLLTSIPTTTTHFYLENRSENIVRDLNVVSAKPYSKIDDQEKVWLEEISNDIIKQEIKVGLCSQGRYYINIEHPNMEFSKVDVIRTRQGINELTVGMIVKVEFIDQLYNTYVQDFNLFVRCSRKTTGSGYFQVSDFELVDKD